MRLILLALFFTTVTLASSMPDLAGQNLINGEVLNHSFSKAKKGTVVVFLSVVCPCSNSHNDHLSNLKTEFADYDFIAINSNADEKQEDAKKHFSELKLSFPVLKETDSIWANRLKAYKTPHSFLISSSGEILYQGGVSSSSDPSEADHLYLKDALVAHKNNQPIKNARARVLGCEIARK